MSSAALTLRRYAAPAQLRMLLRQRLELVALFALVLALPFLPHGSPLGIAGTGFVQGALWSLQALGIVLIVRSSRIINFAQVQLGTVTGLLFAELWLHSELPVLANMACGGCLGLGTDLAYLQSHPNQVLLQLQLHHPGWLVANFWVAAVISVAVAPCVSWAAYRLVIRRFESSSRLIATAVTIALALVLVGLANVLPYAFQDKNNATPFYYEPVPHLNLQVSPAVFHFADVLTLGVVLLAALGLGAFFRFHRIGTGMRAVADSQQRAVTLGIRASRLSAFSWMLAGTLSGISAVLTGMVANGSALTSTSNQPVFTASLLVLILTAVVLARLTSLPLALIATLALGVAEALFFHSFSADVPFVVALFVLLLLALLLQVSRQSRAEREALAGQLLVREARPIPRELRHLPAVDGWVRWFWIVVAVVVLGYPFVMSPAQVSLGSLALIYTIIGISLLVLSGWAGQISLGQFALAAIGGYVTTLLAARFGLFSLIALLAGGLAGSAVAMLVGIPALRLRGLYLAITTVALAFVTGAVLLNPQYLGQFLPTNLDRPQLFGFSLDNETAFFFVALVFLGLTCLAVSGLRHSRTGRALIACRDNEQAGQSFGINLFRARLEAFAISGFIAALAGGLIAYQQHGIQPLSFDPSLGLVIFLIVVIGGFGSLAGPFLGAVYYTALLSFSIPILQLLGVGGAALAVLLLVPEGIGGMFYKLRDAWLRRVAVRYRVLVPSLLADSSVNPLESEAPIAPKLRPGGGTVFVPRRYELAGQWAAEDSG